MFTIKSDDNPVLESDHNDPTTEDCPTPLSLVAPKKRKRGESSGLMDQEYQPLHKEQKPGGHDDDHGYPQQQSSSQDYYDDDVSQMNPTQDSPFVPEPPKETEAAVLRLKAAATFSVSTFQINPDAEAHTTSTTGTRETIMYDDVLGQIFEFIPDGDRLCMALVSKIWNKTMTATEKREFTLKFKTENGRLLNPLNEKPVELSEIDQVQEKFKVKVPYWLCFLVTKLTNGRQPFSNQFHHISNMLLPVSKWGDQHLGQLGILIGTTADGSAVCTLTTQGKLWFISGYDGFLKKAHAINLKKWIEMKQYEFQYEHYHLEKFQNIPYMSLPYKFPDITTIPESFKTIHPLMCKLLYHHPNLFEKADASVRDNEDYAYIVVDKLPDMYMKVSERLKRNIKLVILALKRKGSLLQIFSEAIRDNKEAVIEAVSNCGKSLQFASERLRKDPDVVLPAIRSCTDSFENSFRFAGKELREDREFLLRAVREKGICIKYTSDALKDDPEVVLEAIKQRPMMLQYASKALRNNPNFVMEAINLDGKALKYGSKTLQSDKEFVLEAIQINPRVIEYVSETLRNDKDVVLAAVQRDGNTLYFASKTLCNDLPVVLAAVNQTQNALEFASSPIKYQLKSSLFTH